MQEQNNEMQSAEQGGVAPPAAPQPSNEGSLAARLAEVENELSMAHKALEEAVASAAEDDNGDPVALLESVKKILVEYDGIEKSQNAKDAIQNINYALAALRREISAKKKG